MRKLLFSARVLSEPSGAVATAAAMFHAEELPAAGKTVAIITGGNIESQVLTDILSSHVG
jgi:threonine dehydratase